MEAAGGAPAAAEGEVLHPLPQKKFYRARAHANPLSDGNYDKPRKPQEMDWAEHYPAHFNAGVPWARQPRVRFADVGCGFGGMSIRLAELFPEKLVLGMEIRDKVAEYVRERALALRAHHAGKYQNVSCIRTNSMKFMPNYFEKGQLEKVFFLFPDPHFKAANHRRRVIQHTLLAEYAYLLTEGGLLYFATDVEELADWMRDKLEQHPLFEAVAPAELEDDPCVPLLTQCTEEAQKVERNGGQTWRGVYRRVSKAAK